MILAPLILAVTPAAIQSTVDYYFTCVRDRSIEYAKSAETAEAIALAVISACSIRENLYHKLFLMKAAEDKVPELTAEETWQSRMRPQLHETVRSESAQWVIEARLKSQAK